jgi:hypothetical protein
MLARGDRIPHFEVTTVAGNRVRYADIWQHRHLLLVVIPLATGDDEQSYTEPLIEAAAAFHDVACVITRDDITGLEGPAVVVADKWGEVIVSAAAASLRQLPTATEMMEWVDYMRSKCPECEGEAK